MMLRCDFGLASMEYISMREKASCNPMYSRIASLGIYIIRDSSFV